MPITIDGTGTISGISAGGLPDSSITNADLATDAVSTSKILNGAVTTFKVADGAITQAKRSEQLTLGTAVASTSGTSIDFTGIPSWVKRVTVMFYRISTNGTSSIQVQLGDSGGVETTGYEVSSAYWADTALAYTSGFVFRQVSGSAATGTQSGQIVFNLIDASANRWTGSGSLAWTLNPVILNAGSKELSATLDRVRITTVNGTDTFDAGSINIMYE